MLECRTFSVVQSMQVFLKWAGGEEADEDTAVIMGGAIRNMCGDWENHFVKKYFGVSRGNYFL